MFLDSESSIIALENRLTHMFGAVGTVLTTSGTAALHLALMAMGATHIIIPSYTCVALLNAANFVSDYQGPPLIDVVDCSYEPETMNYNADLGAFAELHMYPNAIGITPSMFGIPTQINGTRMLQDWAMSLGTGTKVYGYAVLSFHSSKMVSGQHGGAVVTNDPQLLARLRDLNAYNDAVVADRLNPNVTYVQRVNYRMSNLNAALVNSQLDRLPEFVARRRSIADYYNDALKDSPAILPTKVPEGSVFGRYCMVLDRRNPVDAIRALQERGIEAGRGVAPCLHHYLNLPAKDFPNAEKAYNTVLSLPVYPGLTDAQVEYVAAATKEVLNG